MARGRHAAPSTRRTVSATPFVVFGVLAVSAAAAALVVRDLDLLRALVALVALLTAVAAGLAHAAERRAMRELDRESILRERELTDVRSQLADLRRSYRALLDEVDQLRGAVDELANPPASEVEPEPAYPALHLPLVKAAFTPLELPRVPGALPPLPAGAPRFVPAAAMFPAGSVPAAVRVEISPDRVVTAETVEPAAPPAPVEPETAVSVDGGSDPRGSRRYIDLVRYENAEKEMPHSA